MLDRDQLCLCVSSNRKIDTEFPLLDARASITATQGVDQVSILFNAELLIYYLTESYIYSHRKDTVAGNSISDGGTHYAP